MSFGSPFYLAPNWTSSTHLSKCSQAGYGKVARVACGLCKLCASCNVHNLHLVSVALATTTPCSKASHTCSVHLEFQKTVWKDRQDGSMRPWHLFPTSRGWLRQAVLALSS